MLPKQFATKGMHVDSSTVSIGTATHGAIADINHYRQVLGSFMTGVTVITTMDADGRRRGITANSFTSVSLDPPLVLFCVDYRAASYETFQRSEGFVVHVLASDQQDLARTFASKSESKFDGLETTPGSGGAPILEGVHGWLDCTPHDVVIAGDHAIIIGEVQRFSAAPARPLGFYQGRFFGFNNDQELGASLPSGSTVEVGWAMQTQDGRVVLHQRDDGSLALPASTLKPSEIHEAQLTTAATARLGAPSSTEFLYSVYEGAGEKLQLVYRGQVFADGDALTGNGLVGVDPERIDLARFTREGDAAVVERYVEELANARFGLYAGSLAEGSIARVDDVIADTREARRTEGAHA